MRNVRVGSGCIFEKKSRNTPTEEEWVERVFLLKPEKIMHSPEYSGEETIFELLYKLSKEGGAKHFQVQDQAIRAGASWLCEHVIRIIPKAAAIIGKPSDGEKKSKESDFQRRKREAKERQIKLMQQKMASFAMNWKDDLNEKAAINIDDDEINHMDGQEDMPLTDSLASFPYTNEDEAQLQMVEESPQCVICGNSKSDDKDVLVLCGLLQPSVVLKGGCMDNDGDNSLVGNHISLCGHAVHKSCIEAHLKGMSRNRRQEDQLERGKRPEFRCPLCR